MTRARSDAVARSLARFAWDVLSAADQGIARTRFCEAAGSLFGCAAVAHVWFLGTARAWSTCLWRRADGDRTVTTSGVDAALTADSCEAWWHASQCRREVIAGMPGAVSEMPLPHAAGAQSILVLEHDGPPPQGLARLTSQALPYVALVERAVVRLEPPALPRPSGEALLSRREVEVLALLSDGLPAHAIAHRMALSERTIHKHLGNLYRKLGVHDRLLAVARGQALGLVAHPPGTTQAASLPIVEAAQA